MSTKEAYAIAKSRGFEGLEASFRSGFSRKTVCEKYRQAYGIEKLGKGEYCDIRKKEQKR